MTQLHTCGGGRPPAPAGHTGSMVSLLGVLHWQSGDGLREVHSGPASISIRTGLIRGISHSVVMLWHGKSLPVEYIYLVRKANSIEGKMINICVGDLLQWLIHHATCPKARLVQQHLTKVSHLSIHRTLIAAMVKSENDNEHCSDLIDLVSLLFGDIVSILPTGRRCTVSHTSRDWGSDLDTLRKVERSEWTSVPQKQNWLAAQSTKDINRYAI